MKILFLILALLFPICIAQATSVNDMFRNTKRFHKPNIRRSRGKNSEHKSTT